jgi:hypothetical protein
MVRQKSVGTILTGSRQPKTLDLETKGYVAP